MHTYAHVAWEGSLARVSRLLPVKLVNTVGKFSSADWLANSSRRSPQAWCAKHHVYDGCLAKKLTAKEEKHYLLVSLI